MNQQYPDKIGECQSFKERAPGKLPVEAFFFTVLETCSSFGSTDRSGVLPFFGSTEPEDVRCLFFFLPLLLPEPLPFLFGVALFEVETILL